ncbi:uncharacterized protein LOC116250802 isoform X1 [Nymphaea colorata]|nr:uncharacterized protein LOC116250802 isoform X1 [Nymphaea colorata]
MCSSIPGLSVPVPTVSRRKERLSREAKSQPSIGHMKESKLYRLRHRNSRFETFAVFAHSTPRLAIRAISASFSLRLSSSFLWWTLSAGVIAFALFSQEFSGRAVVDELPHRPPRYPCEDVSGYYSQVELAEGVKMMEQLNLLISDHHPLTYKEVWDALEILDAADVENPDASSDIVEIYSLRAVPKSLAGKLEGWNREHLWPRSYGLARGPSLTDLHNLRPADVNVNSSRGNKFYGECLHEDNSCLRPANSEAAPDTEADKERWAPPVQVRGDIARSLMYMAVRYGLHQPIGSPTLQLSDSPSIDGARMGLLSSLLKWNEADPPSKSERLRNNRICSLYQHNRNPFIDHPEYANMIWKTPARANSVIVSSSKGWINEFHYRNKGKDLNEFVEVVVSSLIDASRLKLVLYNGANGKMYKSIPLTGEAFSITSEGSEFLIYTAPLSLQNGPADGIALVSCRDDGTDEVIQFLSYEGVTTAIDGPAVGTRSLEIGVRETEDSSKLGSLGLTGNGLRTFQWKRFTTNGSPGRLNPGQDLGDP